MPNQPVKDADKLKGLKISRKNIIRAGLSIASVGTVLAGYTAVRGMPTIMLPRDPSHPPAGETSDPLFSSAGVQFPSSTSDGSNPGDYFTFFRSDESVHGRMRYWQGGAAYDIINNITNADIVAAAGIPYSKLTLTGALLNADVNSSAAIAVSKLAAGSSGQTLITTAGVPTWTSVATVGLPTYKYRILNNGSGSYNVLDTTGAAVFSSPYADAGAAITAGMNAAGATVVLDGIGGTFTHTAADAILFNNCRLTGINGAHQIGGNFFLNVIGAVSNTVQTNCEIDHIEVDGNSQVGSNVAGNMVIGSANRIHDLFVHDWRASASFGIVIGPVGGSAVTASFNYNKIYDNHVVDVTEGIWNANVSTSGTYAGNLISRNTIVTPAAITKFACGWQNNTVDSSIIGNYINGAIQGIDVTDSPNCSILGNNVVASVQNGIELLNTSHYCTCSGNTVRTSMNDGIHMDTVKSCTVDTNTLLNNGQATNATYADIHLSGSNSGAGAGSFNSFFGNTCQALLSNKVLASIAETGTSANVFSNVFGGGSVQGSTGPAVLIIGTLSYVGAPIQNWNPRGYAVTTPGFPATATDVQNTTGSRVRIIMLTSGTATAYQITDPSGTAQSVTAALTAGEVFELDPWAKIQFTFSIAPTWKWYGV